MSPNEPATKIPPQRNTISSLLSAAKSILNTFGEYEMIELWLGSPNNNGRAILRNAKILRSILIVESTETLQRFSYTKTSEQTVGWLGFYENGDWSVGPQRLHDDLVGSEVEDNVMARARGTAGK